MKLWEETMIKLAVDLKPCPFCGRDPENFEEVALKEIYEAWSERSDY